MELQLTADQNQWRDEVRDFLDTELPARWEKSTEWCEDEDFWAFATAFTRKVSARGWIGLTWPKEYGGLARPPIDQLIFSEEFTYRDAPLVNTIGWGLAAPRPRSRSSCPPSSGPRCCGPRATPNRRPARTWPR
jgi:alkylation response protein AidB-like acyl-CoA dehydrogenase